MTALSFVPFLPPTLRYTLPFGLLYLEFAPVLYQYGMRRFSRMDDAAAERYMAALDRSHGPFQMAYQGIRSLVMISFYQQPEVLDVLEVDVRARASELIERRARLLRMAPELGNSKNARTNAERDAKVNAGREVHGPEGENGQPRAPEGSGAEQSDGDERPSARGTVS
ncbi:MAG: hypothetical protein E4H03_07285 [Myxococcales bacterium]|nr:MAG: hypothetical protein E4H03_07285 [Myxococcales bacterium]